MHFCCIWIICLQRNHLHFVVCLSVRNMKFYNGASNKIIMVLKFIYVLYDGSQINKNKREKMWVSVCSMCGWWHYCKCFYYCIDIESYSCTTVMVAARSEVDCSHSIIFNPPLDKYNREMTSEMSPEASSLSTLSVVSPVSSLSSPPQPHVTRKLLFKVQKHKCQKQSKWIY